jgi:hypothetical protein
MLVRVEVGAEGVNRTDASLLERFEQPAVDQLHAPPVCIGVLAGIGFQRTLHVIYERKELRDQIRGGRLRDGQALAIDPLAEIVELCRLAQEQIVVLVALPLKFVGISGCDPPGFAGIVGRTPAPLVVSLVGSVVFHDGEIAW